MYPLLFRLHTAFELSNFIRYQKINKTNNKKKRRSND